MPSTNSNGYALIDCNNFFVSCERVFKPHLEKLPVAVLSSNDGCFIARSQEVKDLKIPMGAPVFQYRDIIERHKIQTFSANFALYSDMSARVMQTIAHFYSDLEIYSIDEAFVPLNSLDDQALIDLRRYIKKWTGITVSIGIAKTKTLAKMANHSAKKSSNGVFSLIEGIDTHLKEVAVQDIWGIGKQSAKKLNGFDILTAYDLKYAKEHWIKQKMHLLGLRVQLELKEIPCLHSEQESSDPKSLTYSRTFGNKVDSYDQLKEAIAHYVSKASEKLRQKKMLTCSIGLYLKSTDQSDYQNISINFATDSTSHLIDLAHKLLKILYKEAIYKKAGIHFNHLTAKDGSQLNFESLAHTNNTKLDQTVDQINKRYGSETLFRASEGIEKKWEVRRKKLTQEYTSKWSDIINIKI